MCQARPVQSQPDSEISRADAKTPKRQLKETGIGLAMTERIRRWALDAVAETKRNPRWTWRGSGVIRSVASLLA